MTEVLDNNNSGELTVLKVYELAADAGKECQQLIEQYGQDSASNVTLKIISILEHLELLVNAKTELEQRIIKVNDKLVVCQNELSRKAEENLLLQSDLRKLEEQHLEDLEEWKELLGKARKENRDLKTQLNEKEGQVIQEKVQEQQTLQVLLKLKETVDKQRDQLRANDNELRSRTQDVEALQQQTERLAKVNANLRRKQELVENHSRALIRQKSTLQVDVMALNKNLKKQKSIREAMTTHSEEENNGDKDEQEETDGGETVTFNLRDPERPRFTLSELRKVLIERDEMHLKVLALQEELDANKSEEDAPSSVTSPGPTPSPGLTPSSGPHDDMSPKCSKSSGIRKFFSNLFKSKDKTDVEEELKKWEVIDFDSEEGKSQANTDPHILSQSFDASASTPASTTTPQGSLPRRHSDIALSRINNSDASPGGGGGGSGDGGGSDGTGDNKEGWVFGFKARSSSMTTEMLEMKSPLKMGSQSLSSATSSPRSTSPRGVPMPGETQPPRPTPPPLKALTKKDREKDGLGSADEEEEEEKGGVTMVATPLDMTLTPFIQYSGSPY